MLQTAAESLFIRKLSTWCIWRCAISAPVCRYKTGTYVSRRRTAFIQSLQIIGLDLHPSKPILNILLYNVISRCAGFDAILVYIFTYIVLCYGSLPNENGIPTNSTHVHYILHLMSWNFQIFDVYQVSAQCSKLFRPLDTMTLEIFLFTSVDLGFIISLTPSDPSFHDSKQNHVWTRKEIPLIIAHQLALQIGIFTIFVKQFRQVFGLNQNGIQIRIC